MPKSNIHDYLPVLNTPLLAYKSSCIFVRWPNSNKWIIKEVCKMTNTIHKRLCWHENNKCVDDVIVYPQRTYQNKHWQHVLHRPILLWPLHIDGTIQKCNIDSYLENSASYGSWNCPTLWAPTEFYMAMLPTTNTAQRRKMVGMHAERWWFVTNSCSPLDTSRPKRAIKSQWPLTSIDLRTHLYITFHAQ